MQNFKPGQSVLAFSSHQPRSVPLHLDFQRIESSGYQIVRNFGTDIIRLEQVLNAISGGKLFYSKRLGGITHEFKVQPHSHDLSEQSSCGGYHTDFMFQPHPPEFIALLCIKPDPKHPFYGRNQIVHYDAFVKKMHNVYSISELDLFELKVKYAFPNHPSIEIPVLNQCGNRRIFRLHTSLMGEASAQKSLGGVPLKNAIEAICGDVAEDIVLGAGDLLIVSNHSALHRRSECTLAFSADGKSFESREMATIRFDR